MEINNNYITKTSNTIINTTNLEKIVGSEKQNIKQTEKSIIEEEIKHTKLEKKIYLQKKKFKTTKIN